NCMENTSTQSYHNNRFSSIVNILLKMYLKYCFYFIRYDSIKMYLKYMFIGGEIMTTTMDKTLKKETIDIIKSTVPVLEKYGEQITKRFYHLMFSNHPELLNIF